MDQIFLHYFIYFWSNLFPIDRQELQSVYCLLSNWQGKQSGFFVLCPEQDFMHQLSSPFGNFPLVSSGYRKPVPSEEDNNRVVSQVLRKPYKFQSCLHTFSRNLMNKDNNSLKNIPNCCCNNICILYVQIFRMDIQTGMKTHLPQKGRGP